MNNFDDDFGFSTEMVIETISDTDEHKKDLKALEDLILPLLKNLSKNSKNPNIVWPDRKKELDLKTKELFAITRKFSGK